MQINVRGSTFIAILNNVCSFLNQPSVQPITMLTWISTNGLASKVSSVYNRECVHGNCSTADTINETDTLGLMSGVCCCLQMQYILT